MAKIFLMVMVMVMVMVIVVRRALLKYQL